MGQLYGLALSLLFISVGLWHVILKVFRSESRESGEGGEDGMKAENEGTL